MGAVDSRQHRRPIGRRRNSAEKAEAVSRRRVMHPVPRWLNSRLGSPDAAYAYLSWQCLYFFPLPQGQSSLRPTLPHDAGFRGPRSAATIPAPASVDECQFVFAAVGTCAPPLAMPCAADLGATPAPMLYSTSECSALTAASRFSPETNRLTECGDEAYLSGTIPC
jgi:hypothetical protein